ncbi:hypothetical protein Tco_0115935 [Tanacetum coccineum]
MMANGGSIWPQSWLLKAPDLGIILAPNLDSSRLNKTIWRDTNGSMSEFSVKNAWESFRPVEDLLRQWDVGVNTGLNMLRYPLCGRDTL